MTNGGATTEEIQRQKELILKNAYLRNVFFEIKEIDVALIGISNLSEGRGISWMFNHLADAGIVEQGLLNRLITEHGFVGEILYQPFRPDGEIPPEAKKLISPVLERAFLSITLDELKKKVEAGKRILLIGSGDNKVRAIVGALRAKYANILITDERTAKRLLDEAQRGITG
jgi:DNA-binding transcriptional regulator LsrR (DeoR family)